MTDDVLGVRGKTHPFSTKWVVASVVIFTVLEVAIAQFLAPLIFGAMIASPMVQMRLQMIMHLASFYVGGVGVGIISPGVRLSEPAVGAFISVVLVFLMSVFLPHSYFEFDFTKIAVGGGIAFGLSLMGAYTGERIMGNVNIDDDNARGRLKNQMWGDHGLLGSGSGSVVPHNSASTTRTRR